MKGQIRVPEKYAKCPTCRQEWEHVERQGYFCPPCNTTPKRFYIDVHYKGQRVRVFCDKQGKPLDTYDRAFELYSYIIYEINNHTFDPSKFSKRELQQFYICNLLDRYKSYKVANLAPSYQTDFKRYNRYAAEFFKVKDIRDIRKIDLIDFKAYFEHKGTLKGKSIKNILDHFKAFMNYVKKDLELIDTVPHFPEVDFDQPAPKWLTQKEQIKVFELIPDSHKPILSFLMLHGCRPGEAMALRCKDVNLQAGVITVGATFSGGVYRERRKGKKSRPYSFPIHSELMYYIEPRVKGNLPEAYLFINPTTGRHYCKNTVSDVFNKVKKKAGIDPSLRLYDATRHSFASNLVNSGSSIYVVSKFLGHSSVKMTEKYAHSDVTALRSDHQKLSLDRQYTVSRKASVNEN